MPSVRFAPAPRRPLLRSLAVAAAALSGAVAPVLLPAAVAAADEPAGTTVVGELVQAWAEAHPDETGDGHEHDGPISWVQPADGDPVLVDTEGVAGVPPGSTVAVTVASEAPTGSDDEDAPLTVLGTQVIATEEETEPVAPAPGRFTNEVTVAMVAPAGSDPKGDGTPLAQVVATVNDHVAPFWSEQSDGAITLGVTVTHDWAPAAVDCATPGLLWDEVATRLGFVPGPGKHLVLYVPRNAGCEYALAEVGTRPTSGGRLYVSDTSPSAMTHEFGHNFGLGHSSAQQCDGAVEGGSCRTVAYRDYYDVMGVSWSQIGSLNAAQASLLGVLPEAHQQSVPVWGSATTATLAPISGRVGTRALRLTDAEGVDYWLEFRTASGRDRWLAARANRFRLQEGVLLRRAGALPDTSVLLDATPTAAAGWDGDHRATLPVGVPVPVSGGDFTVVVETADTSGAVVRVTPSPPSQGRPSAAPPVSPTARPDVLPGEGTAAGLAVAPAVDPAETQDRPAEISAAAPLGAPAPLAAAAPVGRTISLQPVSGTTGGSAWLVPAAGFTVLTGSVLLVRRVRTARRAR